MANQISDILDKPATQIDRPKPLPVGTYTWMVVGMPRHDKDKTGNMYEYVEFVVKCLSAFDDVDEEALAEWATKADGTSRELKDFTLKMKFYKTVDSLYRLQEFITHCGCADENKSVRQCLDDMPNAQFVGAIVHSASKDGTTVYANIGKTGPVEE